MTADDLTFEEICEERFYPEYGEVSDTPDTGPIVSNGTGTFPLSGATSSSYSATSLSSATGSSYYYTTTAATSGIQGINVTPKVVHTFDLAEMGIQQMGTFDSSGSMSGIWVTTPTPLPHHYPSFMHTSPVLTLTPGPDFTVLIRGVYSKYFTNERRAAMGLSPI